MHSTQSTLPALFAVFLLDADVKQYIPPFINWIKYISFTWYAYRLLLKVQFSPDETYSCGSDLALQCPMQSAPAFKNVTLSDAWVDALGVVSPGRVVQGIRLTSRCGE